MKRKNYYILLGLESDPPVTDPGLIYSALQAYLMDQRAVRGDLGLEYHDIEQVMTTPELAGAEAMAANVERYGLVDDMICRLYIDQGRMEIPEAWIDRISAAVGLSTEKVTARLKGLGKRVKPAPTPEQTEPLDPAWSEQADTLLERLGGYDNLYAFIAACVFDGSVDEQDVPTMASDALYKGLNTFNTRCHFLPDEHAEDRLSLCDLLWDLFNSAELRKKYDDHLEFKQIHPIVRSIDALERAGLLARTPDQANALLQEITEAVGRHEKAKRLFERYFVERYGFVMPGSPEKKKTEGVVRCTVCGTVNTVTKRGKKLCSVCGGRLVARCPGCDEVVYAYAERCPSCNTSLSALTQGTEYLRQAQVALKHGMQQEALKCAAQAEMLWPSFNEEAASIRQKVYNHDECTGEFNRAFERQELYRARALLAKIPGGDKNAALAHLGEQIVKSIQSAEKLPNDFASLPEEEQYVHIVEAQKLCVDSPILHHGLVDYHPPEPEWPECTVDIAARTVTLSWRYRTDRPEVRFSVLCDSGRYPKQMEPQNVIATDLHTCKLTIETCPTGQTHMYSVGAHMFGATSNFVPLGTVRIEREVEHLRWSYSDGAIRISWALPTAVQGFRISRRYTGEPLEIHLVDLDGNSQSFTDSTVDLNQFSFYRVQVITQNDQGVIALSRGCVVKAGIEAMSLVQCGEDLQQMVYRFSYHQQEDMQIGLIAGSGARQSYAAGLYDQGWMEQIAGPFLKMQTAASGEITMKARPMWTWVQPVFGRDECVRVGEAVQIKLMIPGFAKLTMVRDEQMCRLRGAWPDGADGAWVVAKADNYGRPFEGRGEQTLSLDRKDSPMLDVSVRSNGEMAYLSAYALYKHKGQNYPSAPTKLTPMLLIEPVMVHHQLKYMKRAPRGWRVDISVQGGPQTMRMPRLCIVNSGSNDKILGCFEGVIIAAGAVCRLSRWIAQEDCPVGEEPELMWVDSAPSAFVLKQMRA